MLPILTYSSLVCYPGFRKDRDLDGKLAKRYRRHRLALKCGTEPDGVPAIDILKELDRADPRLFGVIRRDVAGFFRMFKVVSTNNISRQNTMPGLIARKTSVSDTFPIRVRRKLREPISAHINCTF